LDVRHASRRETAFVQRRLTRSAGGISGRRDEHVVTPAADRRIETDPEATMYPNSYTPKIDPIGAPTRLALLLVFIVTALISVAHVAAIA